ncbi:MAG TPA: alkaline phosphatase [Longimicrobiales bacterium]|nr:alkaline phosphatase [Longimicrobiales bacterium]
MHRSASPARALLRMGTCLVAAVAAGACGVVPRTGPAAAGTDRPRSLILLVTDGGGAATWSVAEVVRGADLAVASMPVAGLVETHNASGGITDSAAGATAYSIAAKTVDGAIGVDPTCRELWLRDSLAVLSGRTACERPQTLLERAEAAGKATGLITTAPITDATPAAFAAHVPDRSMADDIARQMLASGVDVLLGGGRGSFPGAGTSDGLLAAACAEADCPESAAALEATPASERRLIGLFGAGSLPRAGERSPDLPAMTRAALERLALDPDGFFLLVETEGTDSEQHANQPFAVVSAEIAELDRAVAVALDFQVAHPGTLVVVTADHETGGMALYRVGGTWTLAYTSGTHSGSMVPLFASGPGAERLAGIHRNDEVGRILRELLVGGDG